MKYPRIYLIAVIITVSTTYILNKNHQQNVSETSIKSQQVTDVGSETSMEIDLPIVLPNTEQHTQVLNNEIIKKENKPEQQSTPAHVAIPSEPTKNNQKLSHNDHLADKFESEDYDTKWAPEMETRAYDDFYNAQLENSELNVVECRTTLCRIEVSHTDQAAKQLFMAELMKNLNGRRGHIESDTLATTIYQYRTN